VTIILASATGDASVIVWGLVGGVLLYLVYLAVKNKSE
jgi:hypothetical protein